jgi:hypothetical protein
MQRDWASGLLVAGLVAGSAPLLADDSECSGVPESQWVSEQQVRDQAIALGYKVRRVATDDGCYLVKGFDVHGARIELKIDPANGQIVRHDDDR